MSQPPGAAYLSLLLMYEDGMSASDFATINFA
jgi:hypothetical protein